MTDEYYVEPCEFICAKKFLDALDETNEMWGGETWLYRGQNVDERLLPTAMRSGSGNRRSQLNPTNEPINDKEDRRMCSVIQNLLEDRRHANLIKRFLDLSKDKSPGHQKVNQPDSFPYREFRINWQLAFERSLDERFWVRAFVNLADQVGLKVPRDSFNEIWNKPYSFPELAKISVNSGRDLTDPDPEEFAYIGYALARHHRVPTRLLDFTYRPLVAAFFAAYSDESKNESDFDRQIVVWAIRENMLHDDLRVIKHRRGEIGFLQAQEGVFILDLLANEKYWFSGEWIPFEYYLKEMVEDKTAFKFAFPFKQRRELLELLAMKGITMPSLMPSFDNVWQYLQLDHSQHMKFA